MIKVGTFLIALSVAAALSLVNASPGLAKGKAKMKSHRATSSYSQVVRPAPRFVPIERCRHGVWDPYGVRCDDPAGSR